CSELDAMGRKMGYQKGDIIKAINGKKISLDTIEEVLKNLLEEGEVGDKLVVEVLREGKKDKKKAKKLKGSLFETSEVTRYSLEENFDATDEQIALRKAWMG
ncbi:MAG: hypothetical protein AAF740_07250, partial [Bacteroidota bacterium]